MTNSRKGYILAIRYRMDSIAVIKDDQVADTTIESQSSGDKKETIDAEADVPEEVRYFFCSNCQLREIFEYFGSEPPFAKKIKLLEDCYIIEDPFVPPKQGEILILGAHCIKCNKCVCKNTECSIYFDGTYCIQCAKYSKYEFPKAIKDKLNRIIVV